MVQALAGHKTNPNNNLKHSTLHKNVNQVIQAKFYDVIQEETEAAAKVALKNQVIRDQRI